MAWENESLCSESKRDNNGERPTQCLALNPHILSSTTAVHPLRHRLNPTPVVKSMVQPLPMIDLRGKNVHVGDVGVALLVTLITPAAM